MDTLSWLLHIGTLAILGVFGLKKYLLTYIFFKKRDQPVIAPPAPIIWPEVTIQLPIFNERKVIKRLLKSVSNIDYPKNKLHIQILDDSTDDIVKLTARLVNMLKKNGFRADHILRNKREGFKAGALAYGMKLSTSPYIAIFDADFIIPTDFLKKTIPLLTQPGIGAVQVRWGHMNRNSSLLTRLQAMIMDAHFSMEHVSHNNAESFFIFNGTAGIWNRQAITDSGGWQHDTIAEDTDLSVRARFTGWRIAYLHNVIAPAELPAEMNAYKSQQHRWVKGTTQAAIKLAPMIWKTTLPFKTRLEIFLCLFSNISFALIVCPAILLFPWLINQLQALNIYPQLGLTYLFVFSATAVSVVAFYAATIRASTGKFWPDIILIPLIVGLGIGLSLNNARASLEGLLGYRSSFIRTPKTGQTHNVVSGQHGKKIKLTWNYQPILELMIALYFSFCLLDFVYHERYYSIPFFVLFLFGFYYVGIGSLIKRV